MKPSPDRIHSIRDMPTPQSKGKLITFLGMMTYLGELMPHLSEMTAVPRQLMKTNVVRLWEPHHQRAFVELKRLASETPVFKFYDVNQPVTLATDASKYGYGVVIMQSGQPVAYALRRTSQAEQNYAPIENEMHVIIFECTLFLYGQQLIVEMDHKQMVRIIEEATEQVESKTTMYEVRLHSK